LGTAATISPICTLGLPSGDWDLPNQENWVVGPQVKKWLDGVRYGTGEDPFGWNIPL
jgi:hypothetical protein